MSHEEAQATAARPDEDNQRSERRVLAANSPQGDDEARAHGPLWVGRKASSQRYRSVAQDQQERQAIHRVRGPHVYLHEGQGPQEGLPQVSFASEFAAAA